MVTTPALKKLKKLFVFFIVLISLWPGISPGQSKSAHQKNVLQNDVPARVEYIIDGDTFSAYVMLAAGGEISVRVRIMQIDAPEIHSDCTIEVAHAKIAKNRLSELLPIGTNVILTGVRDDKYLGRIDAFVRTADGTDVGNTLIAEKLVRKYSGGHRNAWCDSGGNFAY